MRSSTTPTNLYQVGNTIGCNLVCQQKNGRAVLCNVVNTIIFDTIILYYTGVIRSVGVAPRTHTPVYQTDETPTVLGRFKLLVEEVVV